MMKSGGFLEKGTVKRDERKEMWGDEPRGGGRKTGVVCRYALAFLKNCGSSEIYLHPPIKLIRSVPENCGL
jgi:hypothetical protein